MLCAPRRLARAPSDPNGPNNPASRLAVRWEAGGVVCEKGRNVVLTQEAALVGNQMKGGPSSDSSFKAFGFFFSKDWGYWVNW